MRHDFLPLMSNVTRTVEWILREPDPALLAAIAGAEPGASLHPLTRALLALRGVEDVEGFLTPRLASLSDPFELPQMETAARRILQAVDKKERVILYGDYDVDGITSIAQLTLALRAYRLEPGMFLPHRMDEGYGLKAGLALFNNALYHETHDALEVIWRDAAGDLREGLQGLILMTAGYHHLQLHNLNGMKAVWERIQG